MSKRFGPEVRLRARREYVAVQQTGRRVATRLLTVLALPNTLGRDRLGIVASRKLGNAVVRNRAKRRLRELFRDREPMNGVGPRRRGLDLVVIPKREADAASAVALRADFDGALGRLGAGISQ
jgi:ribonuclease P protein component